MRFLRLMKYLREVLIQDCLALRNDTRARTILGDHANVVGARLRAANVLALQRGVQGRQGSAHITKEMLENELMRLREDIEQQRKAVQAMRQDEDRRRMEGFLQQQAALERMLMILDDL